jgi:hypothetical protein
VVERQLGQSAAVTDNEMTLVRAEQSDGTIAMRTSDHYSRVIDSLRVVRDENAPMSSRRIVSSESVMAK